MELRNIRCALQVNLSYLREYGFEEGIDEDVVEARRRIIELEENPNFAGNHNHLTNK